MKKNHTTIVVMFFLFLGTVILSGSEIFFRENFQSLSKWKPLTFPGINRHTKYSIIKVAGNSVLKAISDSSASGIIYKKEYHVYSYPKIKWKWKISNVYKKGNITKKSGDDVSARIYVLFKYDPDQASLIEKAQYNAAKLIYGAYPPHSSISYIWANKKHSGRFITSPYTSKAKMIIVRSGSKRINQWTTEQVNVLLDYQKAFGKKPPSIAGIAIMSDSDNTKERATAYIEYIEVSQ